MEVVEIATAPASLVEVMVGRGWQAEVVSVQPVLEVSTVDTAVLDVTVPAVQVVEIITEGPSGAKGDVGEQGEQGETGPSPTFEQHFADASMTWTIIHPLNAYPVVTTVDLNGEEIIGDVMIPDKSTVIVNFAMPVAGTARLKA